MTQSEGNTSANASGERSVANSGSISNSMIITGDVINNPPPPLLTSTPSNLPFVGTENFVGRTKALSSVHEALQGNIRVAITAVAGMGGVGKTELAIQYAQKYRDSYPAGLGWFFVRSSDVGVQILSFASSFGLVAPDNLVLKDLKDRVRFIWQHWPVRPGAVVGAAISEPGDVLLVFDDVPNDGYQAIEPYLPFGYPRFKVLLTSRVQLGGSITTLPLNVLEPSDALTLLSSLAGEERCLKEPVVAEQLCLSLGYLPLGIELVGRYLSKKPDLSLSKMLERLEEKGLSAKALAQAEVGMTGKRGVVAAFELSWQELDEHSQELGCLLSLFAEAPIPWKLVEECLLEWDVEDLEDIRDEQLYGLSLLERLDQGLYQLHPLIREYLGQKREQFSRVDALKRGYCRVMVSQAKEFPETPTRMEWEGFAPVVPHLAKVGSGLLEWLEANNEFVFEEAFSSLIKVSDYLRERAEYTAAKELAELALLMCSKLHQDNTQEYVCAVFNLGRIYYDKQDYVNAQPHFEQTLKILKLLGKSTPYIPLCETLLAGLLNGIGDYSNAEVLLRNALESKENSDKSLTLNNLAFSLMGQSFYEQAEEFLLDSLVLRKSKFGLVHPDIAQSLNNIGYLYLKMERWNECEQYSLEAKECYESSLGLEHPHVSYPLSNLGRLYKAKGDYYKAREIVEKALVLREKAFGEKAPDVAICLMLLGQIYRDMGKYENALSLFDRVLSIRENLYSGEHPKLIEVRKEILSLSRFLDD
jgi:tetratricopeptide (TPR) repeat protein